MPDILLLFSSRLFMVSSLTLMSLIHFEFILVYGIRKWTSFIFAGSCPTFPTRFINRLSYPIVCSCFLCQILIDHKSVGISLGSLFCSIILFVCFYASTMPSWLLWPCSIVWYQECDSSNFVLLSQDCCGYLGSFVVPYTFLKYLF